MEQATKKKAILELVMQANQESRAITAMDVAVQLDTTVEYVQEVVREYNEVSPVPVQLTTNPFTAFDEDQENPTPYVRQEVAKEPETNLEHFQATVEPITNFFKFLFRHKKIVAAVIAVLFGLWFVSNHPVLTVIGLTAGAVIAYKIRQNKRNKELVIETGE